MNIDHLTDIPEMPTGLTMLRRIGGGGAGNIFMVQDITGKILALKVITPRWQSSELQAVTVLRELPAHPAVTQIYQTGQLTDGSFFYTMELADNAGRFQQYIPDTLAQRIGCGTLSAIDVLSILRTVTSGVQHLHAHKLFHGDIKPENIIFINGQAKISDFGTLSGSGCAGTAGFIPDEPVNGIDRDCYALAKTLYCAYSSRDAADFPSPPEKFVADEFKIIRQLYMKGCAGQAGKRFASASDWQNALDHALDQISHPHKSRKPGIKTVIITGVLLLSAIACGLLLFRSKTENPSATPVKPTVNVLQLLEKKQSPEPKQEPPIRSDNNKVENKTPPPEAKIVLPVVSKPANFQTINYPQYGYAKSVIGFSQRYSGHLYFHDFRQKFEAVYRRMPDKLNPDFCQKVVQYHSDLDRFQQLRRELSAPDLSPEEVIRRFTQNNYHALFNSLRDRNSSLESKHKWLVQYRLVLQLYDTLDQQKNRPNISRKEL